YALLDLNPPDVNVRHRRQLQLARAVTPLERGQRCHKRVDLFVRHFAVDDDALDPGGLEASQQIRHRVAGLRHGHISDDELLADDAEDHRALLAEHQTDDFEERDRVPGDEGMRRRVELGAAEGRSKAPEQLVGQLDAAVVVDHACSFSLERCGTRARACRAAARTPRVPLTEASCSALTASGARVATSASAASERMADVRKGAHHSPSYSAAFKG